MSSSPAAFISLSRDDSPFVLRLAEDLEAAGSSHVKHEIRHAADADKIIVPIRLEDVKPGKKLQFYLVACSGSTPSAPRSPTTSTRWQNLFATS